MMDVKIEVLVPDSHLERVLDALHSAGAGRSARYDRCVYIPRTRSWRPLAGAHPFRGVIGEISAGEETKVELNCPIENAERAVAAIREAHPYEEPVIYVLPLVEFENETRSSRHHPLKRNPDVFITLTTDFGRQSQGVGMMEAVIAEIAPAARVIHYAHGLDDYDTTSAARVLETVQFIVPAIHVCVCDPGVGTARRPLAILTRLGGAKEVREISNPAIMRQPVSSVFHGRDVFCPAAAHIANGLRFELVGELIETAALGPPPYVDAEHVDGRWMARVIHIDKFGKAHLNISHAEWRALVPSDRCTIDVLIAADRRLAVEHRPTFGDVSPGTVVILDDDDGRPALAVNQGSFAAMYDVQPGEDVVVTCPR
jgi:S-adenosylmethionine hydrolase